MRRWHGAPGGARLQQHGAADSPRLLRTGRQGRARLEVRNQAETFYWSSGRASFWGACVHRTQVDKKFAYKIQRYVPTKRNRETNDAFQKHLYHRIHQTIQRNKMLFANDARFLRTLILECLPWSFASCVVWNVLRLNPAFCARCTHSLHEFAYS